jgi:uncharacterized membrane protein
MRHLLIEAKERITLLIVNVGVIILPFFIYPENNIDVNLSSHQKLLQYCGKDYDIKVITISNNLNKYEIRISSEIDGRKLINTEIALNNPNHSFFWTGFMKFLINNKLVSAYPLIDLKILKEKERGGIEFIYDLIDGKVRCRLLLYPDDEMLYIEWAIDEKVNGNKSVELICLPAILNIIPGQDKVETERAVKTKSFLIRKGNSQQINDVMSENWSLLMDLIWDISDESRRNASLRGGLTGPAGVVFLPINGMKLKYNVACDSDPFIRVIAEYPRNINIIKFAICEFRTIGNQMAIRKMEERQSDIVRNMVKMITTPSELTRLSIDTEKGKIQQLVDKLKERNIEYNGEIFKRLRNLDLARQNWEKEKEKAPVSSEIILQKFYDNYLIELEKLKRCIRKEGKVLLVKGLYNSFYKIELVKKKYPLLLYNVKDAYLKRDYNYGFYLDYFPTTLKEIFEYDVVILVDIEIEALREDGIDILCQYIEDGGGLVILGGYYSYGLSSIYGSKLGEIIPVQSKIFDLQPMKQDRYTKDALKNVLGIPLKPVEINGFFTKNLKWEMKPCSLWQHKVTAKQGAKIHISTDDLPFLITGTFGKGRVAVFTGTVLGSTEENILPFWEWESWLELFGRVISWAANKPLE